MVRVTESSAPPIAWRLAGAQKSNEVDALGEHYSTRPADVLLPRLEAVKETGPGRWCARCPAHDDKHPSLTVKETDDGTLLVRCWAGCPVSDIVAAAGMELADLFPDRPEDRAPLRRGERWVPRDVLRALAGEVTIAVLAAEDLTRGRPLSERDHARLTQAYARIRAAAAEV